MSIEFVVGQLTPNTPHLFADFVELLLVVGYEGRTRIHKNDAKNFISNNMISTDEMDVEVEGHQKYDTDAEEFDRTDRQIDSVWDHLTYRASAFGSAYPFEVSGETLILRDISSIQTRLYRLFLVCSRLRSFKAKGIVQKWAQVFSIVSKHTMKCLLPSRAVVRIFDSNSEDRKNYYSTDLKKALKILGQDLNALEINEKECEKVDASGDGGLDIVGIVDFADDVAGNLAFIGQCAAQEKDWPSKNFEAYPNRFRAYFQTTFDWFPVLFIPICFRNANGHWVRMRDVSGVMVIDRLRAIELLANDLGFIEIDSFVWLDDFEREFCEVVTS